MLTEQFSRQSPGRLVQAGEGSAGYWAFVPHPLPPPLDLRDPELWRELSQADRALGELAGLSRTIPNPRLFVRPFIHREAVLSSRIEGTRTDLNGLYAFEAAGAPAAGKADDDTREVHNYVLALDRGVEMLTAAAADRKLILALHEVLMRGVRGERAAPGRFRTEQNWVGPANSTVFDATYVPPPPEEMPGSVTEFERYLADPNTYPPLVRLALLHYQFEAIHPFRDGNGRVGRLLVSLLLVHWQLLPAPVLYLSAFFEQHRREYYDLLLGVTLRGAWREWLRFFLLGVATQAKDAVDRAKRLHDLHQDYRQRLRKERVSGLALDITDALFENPAVTGNQVAASFGVSHQAAMAALRRLEKAGILAVAPGTKRNRIHQAHEILTILE